MRLIDSIGKLLKKLEYTRTSPFYIKYENRIKLSKYIIENGLAISHQFQYVYCRIYKSGNSTIVASLFNAEENVIITELEEIQKIKDTYFTKPSELSKEEIAKVGDYFKFTFVRNPYSRFLSCYLDKIKNKNSSKRKIVIKALNEDVNANISIDKFLNFLENGGLRVNGHWAPQSDFLVFPIDEYNFIGRLENLSVDLGKTLEFIYNRSCEIVSVVSHKTESKNQLQNLDLLQKERIYQLYKEDFKNFNYRK